MGVHSIVYIDQSLEGQPFTFAAVPHEGDKLLVPGRQEPMTLTVDTVTYVAQNAHADERDGVVEIRASTRTLGN